jgi:uncharacterized protein YggE
MSINQIKITLVIIGLWLAAAFMYAQDASRKITVTGKSETRLEAQYADIQLEIKSLNIDMGKSYEQVIQNIELLTQKLMILGFKSEDLTKSLILQGAEYVWEKDTRVLKGYYSLCRLELKVTQMASLNPVYKELANFKSITILNTDYGRNDMSEIRMKELQQALLAAKGKAELMATTLNAKLGSVISIQELSTEDYQLARIYTNVDNAAAGQNQEAIAYGKVTVTAAVSVEFELK